MELGCTEFFAVPGARPACSCQATCVPLTCSVVAARIVEAHSTMSGDLRRRDWLPCASCCAAGAAAPARPCEAAPVCSTTADKLRLWWRAGDFNLVLLDQVCPCAPPPRQHLESCCHREAESTDVVIDLTLKRMPCMQQMIKEPKLRMINTCNELNAGYAADGYARERGIACCVVTYTGAPCPAASMAHCAAGASCPA